MGVLAYHVRTHVNLININENFGRPFLQHQTQIAPRLSQCSPFKSIGPSGCVRCHGNKVSTINGVIFSSLSLLSAGLLFSQKGLS